MLRQRIAQKRSFRWVLLALMMGLLLWPALAVDVVTEGDMEDPGTANWPHADVTSSNASNENATDQVSSGTYSLKGTSATGQRVDVEWYNAQAVGSIADTDTVTLSLWWGARFNVNTQSAQGDLFAEVKLSGDTWASAIELWTLTLTPSTAFQSGTVTNRDVSGLFTTPGTYDFRVRFMGRTGRDNAATIEIWWDDVVLDVTAAGATTTVGNGADPADAGLCPGGAAAELDAFTLETSAGTDSVSAVQVTFAAGTAAALSLVEITSDDGATVYGSVANPADVQSISLTPPLSVTTTPVQYKVRITPESHAAMPAPPGSSYPVTGTVTDVTAGNTKALNDTASATVTVDNLSPADATWGTITPGDSQIDLAWTNPGDADFAEVVILRNTAAISDAPAEGMTYTAGATIGSSSVVYAGAGTSFTDTGVSNGTPYWYAIFSRDDCVNYAAGAQTGPHTPTAAGETTTVGDGTDPAGASLCPGGAASEVDAFTLDASAGTDQVTAAQVTFAAGTAAGVGLVEVTSDDGATVYGSAANPASVESITLTTPIDVTTTQTQYKLRVTPRSHAAMAPPPGASYAVTARVTDVTVTNSKVLDDTGSATVTVDNLSPADAVWGTVTPGDNQIDLAWSNPGDPDFAQVVILRNTVSISDAPAEGMTYTAGATLGSSSVVYAGTGTSFTDAGVANGTAYWYEIFARDSCVNYAAGAQTGPHVPSVGVQNGTVVSGTQALASSCSQITTSSYFAGDGDDDGSTRIEYNTSNSFPGTVACATSTGASPRQCRVAGLAEGTDYWLQATFSDPDGVSPPALQQEVVGPISVPACGGDTAAPTLLVLVPTRNAVLGGTETFRIQVWDGDDAAPTVQWSVNGGALSPTSVNGFYGCGTNCAVHEFSFDTSTVANGGHYFSIEASDAAGNVARLDRAFQVNNGGVGSVPLGSGLLLRRTHSSQLCIDCHNLPTHSSQTTSTKYGNWAMECLACHTPHNTQNIYLLREEIRTPSSGRRPLRFERNTVGATANSSMPGMASFANEDNATQADGPCQVCHTRTGGATARWRNAAAGGNAQNHYTSGDGQPCTNCHTHGAGFTGGGGGCTGCHFTGGPAVIAGRRPVDDDFIKTSHHVGDGGVAMGGTLTDFDCVVCHAEGRRTAAGDVETTGWHNDGACGGGQNCIDLKNADTWNDSSPTAAMVYSYDKAAVAASAGVPVNWNSDNATWRTETSTHLDPFCLTCHDADGALSSRNQNTSEGCAAGGDAVNPFCDGAITNDYDRMIRNPGGFANGRVVDVASRVSVDWPVGPGGIDPADRDAPGEARYVEVGGPDGIDDPPQGVYSRHAVRGQATSVYGTSVLTTYLGSWNDTSVMGCADCHTADGANTTAGNAHGSNSEYLLKDAFGGATLGSHDNYDAGAQTGGYVCWRCHDRTNYVRGTHTPNNNDFNDSVGQVGSARLTNSTPKTTSGTILGIACTNCHGGILAQTGDPPAGNPEFGTIHGTSQIFNIGPYSRQTGWAGTRQAYRFTNGNSGRWFNPEGWTGTEPTCYTLGSAGDNGEDSFGACTQHGGGTSGFGVRNRTLSY